MDLLAAIAHAQRVEAACRQEHEMSPVNREVRTIAQAQAHATSLFASTVIVLSGIFAAIVLIACAGLAVAELMKRWLP